MLVVQFGRLFRGRSVVVGATLSAFSSLIVSITDKIGRRATDEAVFGPLLIPMFLQLDFYTSLVFLATPITKPLPFFELLVFGEIASLVKNAGLLKVLIWGAKCGAEFARATCEGRATAYPLCKCWTPSRHYLQFSISCAVLANDFKLGIARGLVLV